MEETISESVKPSIESYGFKDAINDYSRFFSKRKHCILNDLEYASFNISKYSLGAGVPSESFFPIKEMDFKFNYLESEKINLTKDELTETQQYSDTPGLKNLLKWIKELQMRYHNLCDPTTIDNEWDLILTPGSQQGLDCIFKAFFDINDTMITERYTYGGMFGLAIPQDINMVTCDMDNRGMIPNELERILSNWNSLHPNKNFPKMLYLIPHGQNPTGINYDEERKQEIYKLVCKFDLLIIEDDPHYFLQLDNEAGVLSRFQSFLKIDIEKRVIRLDTFSKFLSSGIRIGFITTNIKLMPRIKYESCYTSFHSSGLSQIMLEKLFYKWGHHGFDNHVGQVQDYLRKKRDDVVYLLDKYLKDQVSYSVPQCGLYFWVKLLNVDCSFTFVENVLKHKNVIFGVGMTSSPDRTINSPYIRITFSYIEKEDGEVVFKILSDCLKEYCNNK